MSPVDYFNKIKVVSVGFNGRSGSFLLSNLLDGSKNVLSCPPNSLKGNILLKIRNVIKNNRPENWIEKINELTPELFLHDDEVNKNIGVSQDEYSKILSNLIDNTLENLLTVDASKLTGDIFKLIHLAYAISKGHDVSDKLIIVWQQHMPFTELRAKIAVQAFGSLKAITCVRHPLMTLDSHFFHMYCENDDPLLRKSLSYKLAASYFNSLAEWNYKAGIKHLAVKFEDIHMNTELIMKSLSKELGIEYSQSMKETTLDGTPYYFKGARGIITGTNPKINKSNSPKILSKIDIDFLKALLWKVADFYGYDFDEVEPSSNTENIIIDYSDNMLAAIKIFLQAGIKSSYPKCITL